LEQQEEKERCVLDKKKVRSQVWHPKPRADNEIDSGPKANINMVVPLPKEFVAPMDLDASDEELGMAQLTLEPTPAVFEKPEDEKIQHFKTFFLRGFVNKKTNHQDASRWRGYSQPDAIHLIAQDCKV
jgi:hypothetical protein